MKHQVKVRSTGKDNTTARVIAPEDVRRGDYVAVISEIVELPSFLWSEMISCGDEKIVRVHKLPSEGGEPMKVKSLCLPFVFVERPNRQFQTIDVRLSKLVRLQNDYARTVWKSLRARPM